MVEEWRPTHHPDYDVSDLGHVRSRVRKHVRVLKPRRDAGGYYRVALRGKDESVARLVLAAFVGPCLVGQEAMHEDDDTRNNALVNLSYGTHLENVQACIRKGRRVYRVGQENGLAKLSNDQVEVIRAVRPWMFLREIASLYGISVSCVSRVSLEQTYANV